MHLIDLHCDTIHALLNNKHDNNLYRNNLSVDIEKMKHGNSLAQFFALYINKEIIENPLDNSLQLLDKFYLELEKNENNLSLATNYNDIEKNNLANKISAFLTIEGGEALNGSLYNLRNFYRLGVRLITLTWNFPNEISFPNYENQYSDKGLTPFGIELIEEMNRLSMIIDVSHLSDMGFYDVAKYSKKPFIASHSNARAVTNHPRNLTDDMIKTIANCGGAIGINFEKSFLGTNSPAKVADMLRHITHIRNIGGMDVLCLGSDFDGVDTPSEIEDISQMDKLLNELKNSKFSEEDIEKIFFKNALRIIKECL